MFYENIEAGRNWLNRNHPGWFNFVDINTLDMGSNEDDIIAQLGVRRDADLEYEYGFSIEPWDAESLHQRKLKWKKLTEEWVDVIKELRRG